MSLTRQSTRRLAPIHSGATARIPRPHPVRRLRPRPLPRPRTGPHNNDETKQQLEGEAASTLAYVNPEFGCSLGTRISGALPPAGMMTAQAWSDTVCALSASACENPRSTQMRARGRKTCAPSATVMVLYSLRTGWFYSIQLGLSGGHVNKAHSSATTSLSHVNCPYVECETMLGQGEYLKNHLGTVHSLNL